MIYTKTGDKGTTSLIGGRRVKKCDPRVEAYGTVDELNSHVGMLAEMMLAKAIDLEIPFDIRERYEQRYRQLKWTQNQLFVIQTLLATEDGETRKKMPQLDDTATAQLESWIDEMDESLPKLNSFVIAGGSIDAAQAHIARTVCRRAEREIVSIDEEEKLLQFVNRLSDYLFVISRYVLLLDNKKENFWSAE
jgi:cob(I)alamin adenosyltransferase